MSRSVTVSIGLLTNGSLIRISLVSLEVRHWGGVSKIDRIEPKSNDTYDILLFKVDESGQNQNVTVRVHTGSIKWDRLAERRVKRQPKALTCRSNRILW